MTAPHDRIRSWPIGLFGMVMGLFGMALAVQASLAALGQDPQFSWPFVALALTGLVVVGTGYGLKAQRNAAAVAADWQDPLRLVFFPAMSISVMLAATALLPLTPGAARVLWILGAGMQAALSLAVLSAWTGPRDFALAQLTPAWFIPAVGNIVAPIAGARLGFDTVSWVFLAAGLIFWIALLPLVFLRLVTLGPPPAPMRPTLAILAAPPSVGALAWMALTGDPDQVALVLMGIGLTFGLLVAVRMPAFLRLPFGLPSWSLTFPMAALAIASLRIGTGLGVPALAFLGLGLTGALIVLAAWLLLRTLAAGQNGRLFQHPPMPTAP
ncbi:MAG: SLAC1 anion channel family protein [Rhodobacteraceae bacterium]|nr:SLAC1 anion channel family protein [Paracoccaceae bacterium]